MKRLAIIVLAGLAVSPAAAQVSFLMALNSQSAGTGRRVMLFDPHDGTLLNDNFIHESSTPNGWAVVKDIVQIGDEIWISDQTRGLLYRFDSSGTYLESIGAGTLSNIRGFAHHDGLLYVTNAGTAGTAPQNSIAVLDLTGTLVNSFVVGGSPFDVLATGPDELMVVHSSGTNDLTRWSMSGASLGVFHAGPISWGQQISVRASNGNYLVAGWSGATGIYEYDHTGAQVNYISVPAPRGVYELGNGNIFWTGDGFNVYDVTTGFSMQIAAGTGQYVAPYINPEPPCYANCDASTTAPVLNVDDFTCFINEFAGALSLPHEQQVTHYANCDQSTTAPALNVDDFTCFINAFAAGCP